MKKTKRIISFILAVLTFVSLNSISFLSYAQGVGTEDNPHLITTAQELQNINNDVSAHYKLMADIDLSNIDFEPIGNANSGTFTGSFDGNGFTIRNLNVFSGKYAGLFGCNEGVIKNITLENIYVYGTRYIGGICGENTSYGTIENCKVLSGKIESESSFNIINAGGVCGSNKGLMQGNFSNSCDVNAKNSENSVYAGGIVGYNDSTLTVAITNSYNTGNISSSSVSYYAYSYSGGIVGYVNSTVTITNSYNTGNISSYSSDSSYSSYSYSGGIVGYTSSTVTITNSYNNGNIYSSSDDKTYIGGIVGYINSTATITNSYNTGNISSSVSYYAYSYSGGIVGYVNSTVTITNSYNTGNISSYSSYSYSGGIVGYVNSTVTITNSYNTGNISSDDYSGGIVGYSDSYSEVTITNSYNTGNISSSIYSGGIVGFVSSSNKVVNLYDTFNLENTKIVSSTINALGISISKSQMQSQGTYSNWDFDEIWEINSKINNGFPVLKSFKSPLSINLSNIYDVTGSTIKLTAYKNGSPTTDVTWSVTNGDSFVDKSGNVIVGTDFSTVTAIDKEGNKANCNIYGFTPASSVSVTNRTINIAEGKTENSSYLEIMGGSGDYFVNYKSSNDSIVTVDSAGYLTPISAGTSTITATTAGGLVAEQKVTVIDSATSISLPSTKTVSRGEQIKITATVKPIPTSSEITWISSNNDVATVDQEGNVNAMSIGQTAITATTDNGYSDTCTVTVNAPVKSMQFERPIINIYKNDTDKLNLITDPVDTTDTISYSSSSSSYVSVSSDGTITAKSSEKTVTITATASSGVKAYCTVNVISQPVPVTSVTLDTNKMTVKSGEIFKLTDTILPSDATNKNVKWSSTDDSIASVNQDGTVTAHGAGKAIITVEAENGLFDYCEVIVEGSVSENLSEIYIPYVIQENVDYVDVPVKIKNNPGINFASLNIKYDSNVLEPITVSNGEVFPFVLGSIEEESSIVKLLFSSEDNLTGNGNLAVIRFKVLSEQFDNTQVGIYYLPNGIKNVNDEAVSFNLNDGLVLDIEEHEHDFGEWVVTKEPTTTELGEETRTCSICGKTETREIPQIVLDKDTLTAAIEEFDNLNSVDYSTQSYSNLSIVVEEYRTVLETAQSQQEIDDAVTAILEVMYDLVPYLNLNISAENGSYQVQYDSSISSDSEHSLVFGTEVTLTATANEGYKFVGWYDETSGVYLSKDSTFTFKITANTNIKAVFAQEQSATLTFTTYSNWVKDEITRTVEEWNEITSIEELLPEVPYRYGYSNGRWVYDNDEVLAKLRAGENVSIVAEYDEDDTSLPTPPTPSGNIPVLDLYYKLDADENIGSFVMTTGIPENCQIESVGMAFYYKNTNQFNPENFELLLNNKMLTSTFDIDESNIYIANIERFTSKNNWAVRGYITYYDADGNLKTVYSNQINIVGREQV